MNIGMAQDGADTWTVTVDGVAVLERESYDVASAVVYALWTRGRGTTEADELARRILDNLASGTPRLVFQAAYDAGQGFDRYVIVFSGDDGPHVFGMSHNADSPQGVCLYHGTADDADFLSDCRKLDRADLPDGVQRQIARIEAGTGTPQGEASR